MIQKDKLCCESSIREATGYIDYSNFFDNFNLPMINNKLALQKGLPKINEENHFSLVKLPLIDRPHQAARKSLNKNKSGQLPTLNLQVTSLQDHTSLQKDNQVNRHKVRPSILEVK
jgi:hypothetical protein